MSPESPASPSVVLVTGAGTGIGNLTARALAHAGHTVYASMRDIRGRNAPRVAELLEEARRDEVDLRVVELDVQSEESANAAVATVLDQAGRLDTVVHNAGHLFVGYVEAFTAEDIAHLFDINALGIQRVNRAALPHMRERRAGTLVYVGSTTSAVVPPFLGPYVASKFAADALAQVTSYELNPLGIETTIVMPGPFTQGTEHFPNASHAGDPERNKGYAELDSLVERNVEATEQLFTPGVDAHPRAVAQEIVRVLALEPGTRPFRTVVDFTDAGVERVNEVMAEAQRRFIERMGFGELLHVATQVN
ncbi:SDR family oxidoreductase [Nocardioides sp. LHG3406-4]|uniref:SDR family oxidoreductase n=1 Tax=Nocardioides sp. LHG3406-4 TaxID=2804575 RepID=UPI003CF9125F